MGNIVKYIKCFLVSINVIFTLMALTVVGFGVALVYRDTHTENKLFTFRPEIAYIPRTIVILGVAMAILYFIGFLGAYKEKLFLIKFYAAVMLLLLLLKIIVTIYLMAAPSASQQEQPKKLAPTAYELAFQRYGRIGQDDSTEFVDAVQFHYKCCGYKSYEDMEMYNATYPLTCCGLKVETCYRTSQEMQFENCYRAIRQYDYIFLIARVTYYIVLVIQIFCMIGAFHLAITVENKRSSVPLYKVMT